MLVRQTTLSAPLPTDLTPFLPYAWSLLRAPKKLIPFRIKRIEPLFPKYRGWGIPDDSAGHPGGRVGNHVPGTRATGHASCPSTSRPSIDKVLLTVSPLRPPFPSQAALLAPHHRFASLLFSTTSESLFPQALSFHNHLRCPIVFSSSPKFSFTYQNWRRVSSFRINTYAEIGGSGSRLRASCGNAPQTQNSERLPRRSGSPLLTHHSPLISGDERAAHAEALRGALEPDGLEADSDRRKNRNVQDG